MFDQNREDFKLLAYGQYAFSRRGESIAKKDMDLFVEGAMFAYDSVSRTNRKEAPIQKPSLKDMALTMTEFEGTL